MIRKLLVFSVIGLALAAVAGLMYTRSGETPAEAKGKRPDKPVVVQTATVRMQPMPVAMQAVGQVVSEHSVQVRPQISGMLEAVHFREGEAVRKGQLLFSIDDAPYRSALAGARAAHDSARAQSERLAPLADKEFVTSQEYDDARATAGQLRAMLTQAEINLAYTEIRAPIAGRTGSLGVKAGNLVAPGDATPLVVINQMQPILVEYSIPQQGLDELQRYRKAGSIRVFITREDGSGVLGDGELIFIDNAVDTATGTVTLKARLRNEQEQLWPGQYVGVRMQLTMQDDALVVPQTAVQTGQEGNYVYVVEQGAAVVRPVAIDRQVQDLAVIARGLAAGETVVTRAPRNLRPGAKLVTAAAAAPPRDGP